MPKYVYQCADCDLQEERIAGLDDHTAICAHCGGLMLRLDQDVFAAYFEEAPLDPDCSWCTGPIPPGQPLRTSKMCPKHAKELMEE